LLRHKIFLLHALNRPISLEMSAILQPQMHSPPQKFHACGTFLANLRFGPS
jgi:hypothetical protein